MRPQFSRGHRSTSREDDGMLRVTVTPLEYRRSERHRAESRTRGVLAHNSEAQLGPKRLDDCSLGNRLFLPVLDARTQTLDNLGVICNSTNDE